jgi:hypothetical protein
MKNLTLNFSGELWEYKGKGTWYFITLPVEDANQIKFFSAGKHRGWGSIRVSVKMGKTEWQTSIFPDSKANSYLLPIKAEIRKKENIKKGDIVKIALKVGV